MGSNPKPQPSPKDIVTSLMTFVGKETKSMLDKATNRTVSKAYVKYKCPKPDCRNPVVSFLDKTGFNNPYAHLRSCYGKGQHRKEQEQILLGLYEEASQDMTLKSGRVSQDVTTNGGKVSQGVTQKGGRSRQAIALKATRVRQDVALKEGKVRQEMTPKGGKVRSRSQIYARSKHEQALYGYIRLIVTKGLPLCYASDPEVQKFSRYDVEIEPGTLVEIIFKLVELVEKRISVELQGTKGAVLFGGWACNSMHYIAVIASYCSQTTMQERSRFLDESIPRLTLLALSPVGHLQEDENEHVMSRDEITKFNAEAYVQLFGEIFPFFGQDFSQWCLCLIGDNCSTNRTVATLTGKPYVSCNSDKLNLEVNHMVAGQTQLKDTIESVHETMREAKKLNSVALLRNIAELKPATHNPTCWSGKLLMLQRYMKIRTGLIKVRNLSDGNIPMDTSNKFASRTERLTKMLAEIDVVAKSLQSQGHTLAECREDLNALIETVAEERDQVESVLHQCKLGTGYIAPNANITVCPGFESGVVKIQKGLEMELNEEEKKAVACLLKTNIEKERTDATSQSCSSGGVVGMAERLKKRRKKVQQDEYINCDFILGSAAEVERLQSSAKCVLAENRSSMTPQLFEAIVFLKTNDRFWDAQLVSEAINLAGFDRGRAHIEGHKPTKGADG